MLLLWLGGQTLPGFNLEILSDILGVICDDFVFAKTKSNNPTNLNRTPHAY